MDCLVFLSWSEMHGKWVLLWISKTMDTGHLKGTKCCMWRKRWKWGKWRKTVVRTGKSVRQMSGYATNALGHVSESEL